MIAEAGSEVLELGLLFGTEKTTIQEEQTDVFSFPHLLLQEFAAGKYISLQDQVGQHVRA